MTGELVIHLPEPPSVNQLFTAKRHISKKYRAWRKEAGWELLAQKANKTPVAGFYTVLIEIAERSRKDADNCTKGPLDLLVAHRVTDDDRNCKRATAEKVQGIDKGRCRVTVTAWREAA